MSVPAIPTPPLVHAARGANAGDRFVLLLSRRWLLIFLVLGGLYVGLPWLAPLFMQAGWSGAGRVLYAIYSTQCHQLPQRSYFLFGPKTMYSLAEVQAVWQNTDNPFILRQFVGNAAMGWKVAWSDRMVSLYTSMWAGALLYALLRRRLPRFPIWAFTLFVAPLGVDGLSHFVSDLAGLGSGFRDSNAWLAALTGNAFAPSFYAGDAIGSFNWLMRLLTGILMGTGAVWFTFPYLEEWADDARREIENRWSREAQHESTTDPRLARR